MASPSRSRVLELYSGIGGMHFALLGKKTSVLFVYFSLEGLIYFFPVTNRETSIFVGCCQRTKSRKKGFSVKPKKRKYALFFFF